jgi:hypothetical protein
MGALQQGYSWREASRYATIADGIQATKTRCLRIRIFVAWCLAESESQRPERECSGDAELDISY